VRETLSLGERRVSQSPTNVQGSACATGIEASIAGNASPLTKSMPRFVDAARGRAIQLA
jgi:hypothetical protein